MSNNGLWNKFCNFLFLGFFYNFSQFVCKNNFDRIKLFVSNKIRQLNYSSLPPTVAITPVCHRGGKKKQGIILDKKILDKKQSQKLVD